jgi:hypothetical protein
MGGESAKPFTCYKCHYNAIPRNLKGRRRLAVNSNQQRYSTYFSEHVPQFMHVKVVISDKKVRQKNTGYVRCAQKCMSNANTGSIRYTYKKGPSQAGHGYLTVKVGPLLISHNVADFMGCIFT